MTSSQVSISKRMHLQFKRTTGRSEVRAHLRTVLVKIDGAKRLLSEAKTIQEAKHIADVAEAARVYARRVESSIETVNYAAEVKIRAERLLGEMLKQTPKNVGGNPKLTSADKEEVETLPEIGISHRLSARSQKLASVPVASFEQALDQQKAEGREITTTATLRHIVPDGRPTIVIDEKAVALAAKDSNNLFELKSIWYRCSTRDRNKFIKWINQ